MMDINSLIAIGRGQTGVTSPNLRGYAVVERDRYKKISIATINLDINDLNLTKPLYFRN